MGNLCKRGDAPLDKGDSSSLVVELVLISSISEQEMSSSDSLDSVSLASEISQKHSTVESPRKSDDKLVSPENTQKNYREGFASSFSLLHLKILDF